MMDNLVILRETEREDLKQCIKILRDTYDNADWEHKWPYARGRKYLESCFGKYNSISYVVENCGTIEGAIFSHVRPWWDKDQVFIDEILISKEAIGKGYDRKLLGMVEAYVKENNLGGILLATREDTLAYEFYKENNFVVPDKIKIMHKKYKA